MYPSSVDILELCSSSLVTHVSVVVRTQCWLTMEMMVSNMDRRQNPIVAMRALSLINLLLRLSEQVLIH